MTANLYTMANGQKAMAWAEGDETPWHKDGQIWLKTDTVEEKKAKAGFNFQIVRSPVEYAHIIDEASGLSEIKTFTGQEVLHRNDTGEPFACVSSRYKEVQPDEIWDFFSDWCEKGDMTMRTAGVLGNGSKFWALASIGESFNVNGDNGQDLVDSYVLMATSADKSMATVGKLTLVRVVCQNTLQLSLNDGRQTVKVPHSTAFDADQIKVEMGLVHETVHDQIGKMQKIHNIGLSDEQAMKFFLELLKTPEEKKSGKVDIDKKKKELPKYWESYKAAPGAENTVWGAVNAVTHAVDYNKHARSDDTRLTSAWFGQGAIKKQAAYALATDDELLEKVMVEMVDGSLQEITHEEYAVKKTGIDGTGDLMGLLNKKVSNY
jgi:phage/plasmid-like protein (TIGR03299 family)